MIRTWLALSLSLAVLLGLGCSGSTGTRSGNKAYFGPGSAPATVTTQTTVTGCPGDSVGDDTASATTIAAPAPSTSTNPSIDCVGDNDVYAVFLTASTTYTITTAGADVQIIFIDRDGTTVLGQDETPGGAVLSTGAILASDTYFVVVLAPSTAPNATPAATLVIST